MPYVKSISIHTTVNRSIAYILNPDKTEDLLYTTSLNCLPNAKDAYLAMKTIYEHFSGEKFNAPMPLEGKGSVKAIHYIQSFDPQDNVSPELAHRIAKAFARKTFGDDCQIVIATHNDKNHVHNHFIINTYSLTVEKFNDNWTTRKRIREYSDRVCLAFGIKPIIPTKEGGKTLVYNEWEHKRKCNSSAYALSYGKSEKELFTIVFDLFRHTNFNHTLYLAILTAIYIIETTPATMNVAA